MSGLGRGGASGPWRPAGRRSGSPASAGGGVMAEVLLVFVAAVALMVAVGGLAVAALHAKARSITRRFRPFGQ